MIASFVYDGDGQRVKKVEGSVTTVYVNKYYEKRIGSPDEVTLYYYLGDRMVALKKAGTLRYMNQDHLDRGRYWCAGVGSIWRRCHHGICCWHSPCCLGCRWRRGKRCGARLQPARARFKTL